MHSCRGDATLAGKVGLDMDGFHAAAQASWAPLERVSVAAAGFAASHTSEYTHEGIGYLEAGPGFRLATSPPFHIDVYLLAGAGTLTVRDDSPDDLTGRIKADIRRHAIQPVASWIHEEFELGASLRLEQLRYHDVRGDFVARQTAAVSDRGIKVYLREHERMMIFEPAVTLRSGSALEFLPGLRVLFQTGLSRNLTKPDFHQKEWWLAAGLVYVHKASRNR